ncbi:MAG: nuclear transport factor 2 family protein [Rhodospirillaceae bacterium]|nr:nuclear transport factor 2 family protein [Rhodospirillaceae bacterium]
MNAAVGTMDDIAALADELAIRRLVAQWAFSRDLGAWDDLRACYHDDGVMSVSWYDGSAAGFVEGSKAMTARRGPGDWSKHSLGATRVILGGARALSETDVAIRTRGTIAGVAVDTTSYSRFWDRMERRGGTWRILHRTAIYERDRLDPVAAGADWTALYAQLDFSGLPEQCKHLGATLRARGHKLMSKLVMSGSEAEHALRAAGHAWLEGRAGA